MVTLAVILLTTSNLYAGEEVENPTRLKVNKLMLKNFVKSLIIPGWGQYENGNKIKGILYVTAEIAGIYSYHTYYSAGSDKEIDYQNYADTYWYYGRFSPSNDPDARCGSNLKTHEMPILRNSHGDMLVDENGYLIPLKDQHYYENISKYPEFVCGWDDWDPNGPMADEDLSPHKLTYVEMRTRSNELYRDAQIAGTLIMLNHLISAFDAALGTDLTSFESTSFAGKFYINPLNVARGISMEVTF